MAALKYLVIHCTATPEGREVSAADIRRWHTSPPPAGRGWKQVGYTDMFHLDGRVERLVGNNEDAEVDPWERTNGARGYNAVSRTTKDTRTLLQKNEMARYVREFHQRHPDVRIIGHRDLDKGKDCPSFDVKAWLKEIGIH